MKPSHKHLFTLSSCVAAAAIALASPFAAQAGPRSLSATQSDITGAAGGPSEQGDLPTSLQSTVTVMVEMDAPPAAVTYAQALKAAQADAAVRGFAPASVARIGASRSVQISAAAASQVRNEVITLDARQQALLPSIANAGGQVIFRTQRVYNGIAVTIDPRRISELAAMPGVKAVHPMAPKFMTGFNSIDFLGTRSFWNKVFSGGVGIHGEGIKVGDIDTGLDYLHADFGGPGTSAPYASINDTSPVPNAFFPTAKIPGGFDFAGDGYNASGNAAAQVPHPDPNPLDANGHGTGTASLIGGFGVNPGGTKYVSNYDSATPVATLKIAPGMAPQCLLYPLRVFGTTGSTNLTTKAIEYSIDPNGDGNFSDHLDVINMSLGSNFGYPDDDSAIAATNASAAGIIVCSASGNAGDSFYITSAPAIAGGTLSVAASFNDQAGFIANAQICNGTSGCVQPAGGSLSGQKGFGIYANTSTKNPLAGNVVYARPATGDTAFTNAAQVSGNIVLIDRGINTFSDKFDKAKAAGAIGIIIANNNRIALGENTNDPITQDTSTTSVDRPDLMISKEDGDYIKSVAGFDATTGVPATPTRVGMQPDNASVARTNAPADTIPSYSSRGPGYGNSFLKPDITAPAEVVGVAANGVGNATPFQGNETGLFNGTSSATPHVAGSMALMKQLRPTWTVEELMALAMNTSLHDLETTTARTTKFGDGRIGSGRLDNDLASKATVVAFNATNPGLISVSFGVVQVPVNGEVHLTKNVTVRNKGGTSVSYNLSYQENGPAVGNAYYGTTSPLNVTVPGGGQITVPIQINATGSTLEHTKDPSVPSTQVNGRQYLTEKEGYLVLNPSNSTTEPILRVPLHTALKPVSSMHATTNTFTPTADNGSFNVTLDGAGINSPSAFPVGILSLAKTFELAYASPLANSPNASTDKNKIKYVGIYSDYPTRSAATKVNTRLHIAIDSFGDSPTPDFRGSDREIWFDTDKNGTDDFAVYVNNNGAGQENVFILNLFNFYSNGASAIGTFVNGFSGATLDTNIFNNSGVIMSIPASVLGYTGGASSFNYHVLTFDRNGNFIDDTGTLTYDLANAGVDAGPGNAGLGSFYQVDLSGTVLTVNYNGAAIAANKSKGLMILHMHNGTGSRSDVVVLQKATISGFSPTHAKVGANVVITGTNFGPGTKVFFSSNKQATPVTVISDTTVEVKVPAGAVTGPITVSNAGGSSTSSTSFTVDP
ncbi:MAG TPA: S8 family serine peptidase [Chthoniobacterales bacterium]|nr:S8 family serine peptidase [Chthoniobacterales bacterium]